MPLIFSKTATLTADEDWELPPLDLSQYRDVTFIVDLTDSGSGASNKLDSTLQMRWQDGAWIDRAHAVQFDGAQADARVQYTIQADVLLASGEQGVLGALAENTVRNGPMSPLYYESQVNPGGQSPAVLPAANCRIHNAVTDGGTPDPSFTVGVYVYCSGVYPGMD